MSTLEGAVPLGLGITKLRLWDELHRAHCETMHPESQALSSLATQGDPYIDLQSGLTPSQHGLDKSRPFGTTHPCRSRPSPPNSAKKRRTEPPESRQLVVLPVYSAGSHPVLRQIGYRDPQAPFSDWFIPNHRGDSFSRADDAVPRSSNDIVAPKDSQGVLMPPPPPLPGPSRRRPPPLVARIKAKARRAKRKQQKAEYRRRLFLAHLVQVTSQARQRNAHHQVGSAPSTKVATSGRVSVSAPTSAVKITKFSRAQQAVQQAWLVFPECLGVDLGSFVEIVFDTDAQSSEITAPSDISDDELAQATKIEIDNRRTLGGADVQVPKGVFRWMVARDFAERWPQKTQHVRGNPWPGLEHLWGSPSGSTVPGRVAGNETDAKARAAEGDDEPIRWQSGRRSRFIRKKEEKVAE